MSAPRLDVLNRLLALADEVRMEVGRGRVRNETCHELVMIRTVSPK
jgi:hypothetical protein